LFALIVATGGGAVFPSFGGVSGEAGRGGVSHLHSQNQNKSFCKKTFVIPAKAGIGF
jgi:hypothetical protein